MLFIYLGLCCLLLLILILWKFHVGGGWWLPTATQRNGWREGGGVTFGRAGFLLGTRSPSMGSSLSCTLTRQVCLRFIHISQCLCHSPVSAVSLEPTTPLASQKVFGKRVSKCISTQPSTSISFRFIHSSNGLCHSSLRLRLPLSNFSNPSSRQNYLGRVSTCISIIPSAHISLPLLHLPKGRWFSLTDNYFFNR